MSAEPLTDEELEEWAADPGRDTHHALGRCWATIDALRQELARWREAARLTDEYAGTDPAPPEAVTVYWRRGWSLYDAAHPGPSTDPDPGSPLGTGMEPADDATNEELRERHRVLQDHIEPKLKANERARQMPGVIG